MSEKLIQVMLTFRAAIITLYYILSPTTDCLPHNETLVPELSVGYNTMNNWTQSIHRDKEKTKLGQITNHVSLLLVLKGEGHDKLMFLYVTVKSLIEWVCIFLLILLQYRNDLKFITIINNYYIHRIKFTTAVLLIVLCFIKYIFY